jgi:two-component system chemotaxis response regulator CheY
LLGLSGGFDPARSHRHVQGWVMMRDFLIVDDSRVVRKVARQILEQLSFRISEAEDGLVALDACRRQMPDAILLDWNMPNMNGIEFLRALRQEQGGDRPIVLFCTTENDFSFMTQAIEAGANEYIMKPFDREIITSKLAEVGLCEGSMAQT